MTCGTFSMARRHNGKGPKLLCIRKFMNGLPDLKRRGKLRVELANDIVVVMYDLCLLCIKANSPFCIETPRCNFLWTMPYTNALGSAPGIQKARCDYYKFGTPRKRLTAALVFGNPLFKQHKTICSSVGTEAICVRLQIQRFPLDGIV